MHVVVTLMGLVATALLGYYVVALLRGDKQ